MLRRTFLNGFAFLPALLGFRKQEIPQQLREITAGDETLLVDLVENYVVKRTTPAFWASNPKINNSGKHHVIWYDKQGLLHNENGPAREYPHGKQEWMIHGNYRTDVPAITYRDGAEYFCAPCLDNGRWIHSHCDMPLNHNRFHLYEHNNFGICETHTIVKVKKIWLKEQCARVAHDTIAKIEDDEGNMYISVLDTDGIFYHFQKI